MLLIPAIDLKDGQCVRLKQGVMDGATVFSENPAAMAREIGIITALSNLTGQITKAGLEKTISRRTKVAARLVPLATPEAAIDVDKPEDLTLVRNILALG